MNAIDAIKIKLVNNTGEPVIYYAAIINCIRTASRCPKNSPICSRFGSSKWPANVAGFSTGHNRAAKYDSDADEYVKRNDRGKSQVDGKPFPGIRHGFDCPKASHNGCGHLHAENDDSPYHVDGVRYCGRCHVCFAEGE